VGELTASLAHELNQPLAAILANSDAGQRYLRDDKTDPAEMCAVLSEIGDDVRRASDVIKQLRTLLRKDEVHAGELDLNELARGVLRLVDNDALLRKVRLEFEPAATPPFVHGVAVQLQQVVLNLVVNAFEATAVRADAERRVAVRIADAEGETVELVVEDSGHGLNGHDERIFEPFFTTKAEGMGMGLSIARTIVSSHGGTIVASDNLARGATFRVLLPRSSVSVS
jgi:two-component system sensor kinase FixL